MAIPKLLVKKIITHWPNVNIIFREGGAFCRHKMFNWCESNNVKYITGMSANSRFVNCAKHYINQAENLFIKFLKKQKVFGNFGYSDESWERGRRVIVKARHNIYRTSRQILVTNLF